MTEEAALAKYEVGAFDKRRVWGVAWISLIVSGFVSAGLWILWAAAATGDISDNSDLLWPEPWVSIAGVFMLIGIFGLLPAIVVAIVAGVRGGRSRRVALIGGFILVSPAVWLGVSIALSAILWG